MYKREEKHKDRIETLSLHVSLYLPHDITSVCMSAYVRGTMDLGPVVSALKCNSSGHSSSPACRLSILPVLCF